MQVVNGNRLIRGRRLLFAQSDRALAPGWHREIEDVFQPVGVVVCRACSSEEAVRNIELGGLSAAVLMEDSDEHGEIDVFSLLRIIRSIDESLPCWLVTRITTRRALERALELRVQSLIQYPSGVGDLIAGLRKHLSDPALEN